MFAQEMVAGLHVIINDMKRYFRLKTVRLLDMPCGDMQWMSRFLQTRDDINYTGIDIVSSVIDHHRVTYARRPWTFRNVDIAADSTFVNNFHLILSRHMLQHLENATVFNILKKLSDNTRHPSFLLATKFSIDSKNVELKTHKLGRYRVLNLELAPFRLEPPLCLFRDGRIKPEIYAGLWRLPLTTIHESFCSQSKPANFLTHLSTNKLYSCVAWGLPGSSRHLKT